MIFQNLFITFVKKIFSSWYLGRIYLLMGATYPRNMDQIWAGAPRPCLSCYDLYFIAFKVDPSWNNTLMPMKNSIIKIVFKHIFRNRLQFSPGILFYVFYRLRTGTSKYVQCWMYNRPNLLPTVEKVIFRQ